MIWVSDIWMQITTDLCCPAYGELQRSKKIALLQQLSNHWTTNLKVAVLPVVLDMVMWRCYTMQKCIWPAVILAQPPAELSVTAQTVVDVPLGLLVSQLLLELEGICLLPKCIFLPAWREPTSMFVYTINSHDRLKMTVWVVWVWWQFKKKTKHI